MAGLVPRLQVAQATLLFPPPLVLQSDIKLGEEQTELPGPKVTIVAPASWAREQLESKEAVDTVCKRVERLDLEHKAEVLRSAVLLAEDHRIEVEALPNSCLRVSVLAERPEVAVLLCEGLLAYLNYKTKIPLENPNRDQLTSVEQKLRLQEKDLGRALWDLLAFDLTRKRDPNAMEVAALDLQDYQATERQYRKAMRDHFFRESKLAAVGPSFTVIEPSSVASPVRPWWSFGAAGALAGGLLSSSLGAARRRSLMRKNVLWSVQERGQSQRTAHPDN